MDERDRKKVCDAVERALTDGPFSMKRLSAECGIGYDLMRAWKNGRRRPTGPGARKLLAGLDERVERISELADELRAILEAAGA